MVAQPSLQSLQEKDTVVQEYRGEVLPLKGNNTGVLGEEGCIRGVGDSANGEKSQVLLVELGLEAELGQGMEGVAFPSMNPTGIQHLEEGHVVEHIVLGNKNVRKWKRQARGKSNYHRLGIKELVAVCPGVRKNSRKSSVLSRSISPKNNGSLTVSLGRAKGTNGGFGLPNNRGKGPSGSMIGLYWNVRGLGNQRTVSALKRVVRKYSPSLVFQFETKLNSRSANKIRDYLGFTGGLAVDSDGKSGCLLLIWCEEWEVSILSYSKGHIDARMILKSGFQWIFSGFYGNPNSNLRANSWELLRRLRLVDNLPWVCGGDFNELLSLTEKGDRSPSQSVLELKHKLNWCATRLLQWSSERFGSFQRLVTDKQKLFESLYARSGERARAYWLAGGDRNSKYFHARASARRKKNAIASLMNEEGNCYYKEEEMSKLICQYFSNIFQSSKPSESSLHSATYPIAARLDGDMCNDLAKAFLAEEVKMVVLKVLNGEGSICDFNNTNVVLIPKIKNAQTLKDFRPISLCSVMYKIVTKVLANRLKVILPVIISPSQSAFVPGRQIFDNVLASFEILHSINKRKQGSKGLMALKLDMSKAYDRVEWDLLSAIMVKMNFPSTWIKLISDCISSSKLSFVFNGRVVGSVVPSRVSYKVALCHRTSSFYVLSILFSKASVESGLRFKELLEIYEKGLGQQVNLDKSSISFSPNVPAIVRFNIHNIFGIGNSRCHDKYLGLPTLVGRNKRKMFNEIKERVWKRVRGWKGSMFSFGGKEVLIKAVAQAIPTYMMSIFQLPLGLCHDLSSMMSKFWWGSKEGRRKISWIKWDRLCLPKVHGGLGFKNLSVFNQSLVAKALSRLGGCFRSSQVWGRALLVKGLRWKVGDGSSIQAFVDLWLPRPMSFKPITLGTDVHLKVAEFINKENHCLDICKLDRTFLPLDKAVILSIPVSFGGGKDVLAWHFDKKGSFLVKSGYHVGISDLVKESSSDLGSNYRWWNALWNLNIPPKSKIFIWRAYFDTLPSFLNLWKMKVVGVFTCIRCGAALEFVAHSLFWCNEAKKVWDISRFGSLVGSFKNLSVPNILRGVFASISREAFADFCLILWSLWENRNSAIHNGSYRAAADLLDWSSSLLVEFQGTKKAFLSTERLPLHSRPPNWLPPLFGLLKLNSDAAVRAGCDEIGLGAVIRDAYGRVVAAVSKSVASTVTAELAKLLALREGLLLAKSFNLIISVAEVDATNVASMLNSDIPSLCDVFFLITDIKGLCKVVGDCRCQAISRLGNSLAHHLAALAFSSFQRQVWENVDPMCIMSVSFMNTVCFKKK
ncbi:hypothetical protein Dsin_016335 [Dipteronia sinensis]|uniref:Reverse transcriptase domain-containing protein n=1 Tax=Dipteronia sinensis TaxID=43782 RepID=A0AAE0AD09_9ROSI|nr:hypothetical protein Dsin_016335 [Dipteronia sinensis]